MNNAVLHLSYRELKELPQDLLEYDEFLQEIYLKENYITRLPLWLFQLSNIRFIHLAGNSVDDLPEEVYFLENLEFLDLSNNRLTRLPSTFGSLKRLQRFNVSRNQIEFIPETIGKLKKLESFDLGGNNLKRLPTELGECTELYEIVLNDNQQLQSLPNQLTYLPKIDTLCADRCGLLYLPPILSESLTHVRLFNNTLVTHIPIVYKKHIRRFYEVIHPNCDSISCKLKYLTIEEFETNRKLILPFGTRHAYLSDKRLVFTLLDQCMRVLSSCLNMHRNNNNNSTPSFNLEVPMTLIEYLKRSPVAACSNENCERVLFSEYYLIVVKRINSSSLLIFSCNFCSFDCQTEWQRKNFTEYYSVDWRYI